MPGKRERSYSINLLDEIRAEYKMAEFEFSDKSVVRVNLEALKSIEELLGSLKVRTDLMRYYPIERRPYIEFSEMPGTETKKIYIKKVN